MTVRKVAKNQGWVVSEQRVHTEKWDTQGQRIRLICSTKELAETAFNELEKKIRPLDVIKLAQDWRL